MADLHPVPPKGDTTRQKSPSGNAGVYSQPEPIDTFESTSKKRVGVYDRPDRVLGSWSPMLIIALILGALVLLWMLGMFDSLIA
jgi:hypothetical protein